MSQQSITDQEAVTAAAELFKALSSPVRVQILRLAVEPRTVTYLVDATGLSQPLVSQHLKVLRAARLVRVNRVGREMHYQVLDDHITHVVEDAITHAREEREPDLDSAE